MTERQQPVSRFPCTPGGVVARGRRRMEWLFLVLALIMLAAAVATWVSGRLVPGLLAITVVVIIALARRMSRELQPRAVEMGPGSLTIETESHRIDLPIDGAKVRQLEASEIRHLERLASVGGIVAGSGGFDSHLLGEFDLYASNLQNSLLVDAAGSRLVLTPDRPEEFVETFRLLAASPPATILSP